MYYDWTETHRVLDTHSNASSVFSSVHPNPLILLRLFKSFKTSEFHPNCLIMQVTYHFYHAYFRTHHISPSTVGGPVSVETKTYFFS